MHVCMLVCFKHVPFCVQNKAFGDSEWVLDINRL